MPRPPWAILLALLLSGCLQPATGPEPTQDPAPTRDPERVFGDCVRAPESVSWHDGALFAGMTADRQRWRLHEYPAGPGLPLSEEARRLWGSFNLTKLRWEMPHPEPLAVHRDFSLDGERFLAAELERRFTPEQVRAGFDSFLDHVLAEPEAADRHDLWMLFNRSRSEDSSGIIHRDGQGPPYWGQLQTYGFWLPELALNVSALVDEHALPDAPMQRGHAATNGLTLHREPWAFDWTLEVRALGFNGPEHEGSASLRVDAHGGVTFSGGLWDEPDATEPRWVSWMESILPEVGARVPARDELRYSAFSC